MTAADATADVSLAVVTSSATPREGVVLAISSLVMLFAQATVYAAFGIALFAMAGSLHWSSAQAGAAFTVLVIACCIASAASVVVLRAIGGRWTMVAGCGLLAVAWLLAANSGTLAELYGASALAGAGFALAANTPAIFLIAGWSRARAPRAIGIYLMVGAFGNAVGPPIAQALVDGASGWRGYWLVIAAAALALGVASAFGLREPPGVDRALAGREGTAPARLLRSSRFLILAAAMVGTQLCVVSAASIVPGHVALRGWPSALAAVLLGAQGLVGALATGLSGFLTRALSSRRMLVGALLLQGVGMILLAAARAPWQAYAFIPCFGIGTCVATLAVTVLCVDYFGEVGATAALAIVWTLSGAAAFGPWIGGAIADGYGSFAPALVGLGLLQLPLAGAALFLPGVEARDR